jgi:hypothetical protein
MNGLFVARDELAPDAPFWTATLRHGPLSQISLVIHGLKVTAAPGAFLEPLATPKAQPFGLIRTHSADPVAKALDRFLGRLSE